MRNIMGIIGLVLFGGMTAVNLTVFGLVMVGLFRRTRIHH